MTTEQGLKYYRLGFNIDDEEINSLLKGTPYDTELLRKEPGTSTDMPCSRCGATVLSAQIDSTPPVCIRCMGWSADKGDILEFLVDKVMASDTAMTTSAFRVMIESIFAAAEKGDHETGQSMTGTLMTAVEQSFFGHIEIICDEELSKMDQEMIAMVILRIASTSPEHTSRLNLDKILAALPHTV